MMAKRSSRNWRDIPRETWLLFPKSGSNAGAPRRMSVSSRPFPISINDVDHRGVLQRVALSHSSLVQLGCTSTKLANS
jgi:hypothetical protein